MDELKQLIVRRSPPANISDEGNGFFVNDFEVRIPVPHIRILDGIVVGAEGFLFRGGRLLLDSFSQPGTYDKWKRRTVIKAHLQNIYRKRSRFEQAVWVTDDWSSGYFHWLSDALPKIIVARAEIEEYGLLLPAHVKNLSFVGETLSILGIGNFRYVPPGETVRVDKLHLPVHTRISGDFNESLMREIRQLFRSSVVSKGETRRIYVSRRKANKRRIMNERDILGMLSQFGFAVVETEDLSFREQVDLFSGCEYFISIHGAGLMNMLFMPEGGKVLEIRKPDNAVPNCYFNLASALRLPYFYQLAPAVNEDEPPHSADLIVDIDQFRKHIEKMVSI